MTDIADIIVEEVRANIADAERIIKDMELHLARMKAWELTLVGSQGPAQETEHASKAMEQKTPGSVQSLNSLKEKEWSETKPHSFIKA